MSKGDFTVDMRQFNEGIFYRQETTDEALPEILNRAARNVAYRAAQFTPVATKASVRASLTRDKHLLAALTSLRLLGKKLSAPEFKKAMENTILQRLGSLKYLRSGWAPIIRAMGGRFKGGVNQKAEWEYHRRSGIHSTARRATRANLAALLTWITDQPTPAKAAGAEKIAGEALQKALNFVGKDMVEHAQEKLAKLYL